MARTVTKTTKVTRKENYDNMSLSVKFPSGGSAKWYVSRGSDTITVSGSNDPVKCNEQSRIFHEFLNSTDGTFKERFDIIEPIMKASNSVGEMVAKMSEALLKSKAKKPCRN